MERVQFQQEQMLPELKDLVDKGLFTEKETKEIFKRRTAFETALVRRVAKKSDYLRYIAYEMGLEQLRRKRVERLKIPRVPSSVSDYALVRRQFQIFERALKKFKSDVDLWVQYIQVTKQEGARSLVGRVTARALQLHPNEPTLYIIAASHELDNLSPSAARTLLQRGLRLNADSVELWREYVKMELSFIESLRRRWDVLGIKMDEKGKNKGEQVEGSRDIVEPVHPRKSVEDFMEVDEETDGDKSAAARRDVMQGAIVKSVMTNAARALGKIELFDALKTVIEEHPCAPDLRHALLDHFYDLVRQTLPNDAKAIKLSASRFLTTGSKGIGLIEALGQANEEMLESAGNCCREEVLEMYSEFVEEWCGRTMDENMELYLISSLRSLLQRAPTSPSLLSTHIRLLVRFGAGKSPAKVLRICQKYTNQAPQSSRVWLARLDAERQLRTREDEDRAILMEGWAKARSEVRGSEVELIPVWMWGIEDREESVEERVRRHEMVLKESLRDSSLQGIHEFLLSSYVTLMDERESRRKPVSSVTSDQVKGDARR
ncbi:hypothetical protein AX17_005844 [Amanita inopinata Kibby_2008]|nr:hypothetical protein AX17_005844 [Amanita inopinata Kibby_2008]